jgi:hypothetical protein
MPLTTMHVKSTTAKKILKAQLYYAMSKHYELRKQYDVASHDIKQHRST